MPTTTRLTATPHTPEFTATDGAMLYLALELSQRGWTLAFTTGRGRSRGSGRFRPGRWRHWKRKSRGRGGASGSRPPRRW